MQSWRDYDSRKIELHLIFPGGPEMGTLELHIFGKLDWYVGIVLLNYVHFGHRFLDNFTIELWIILITEHDSLIIFKDIL